MSDNPQTLNSNVIRNNILAALGNGQTTAISGIDFLLEQLKLKNKLIQALQIQIKNLEQKNEVLETKLTPQKKSS